MLALIDPSYPIYIGVFLLILILILLLRINNRLAQLTNITPRTKKISVAESVKFGGEPAEEIDAPSGTHFDEFLHEDPTRQALPKKEQFKAFRKWRADKGLNWTQKD